MKQIKVFVPNLKERPDRKTHISSEFKKFNIFDLKIINAIKHTHGSIGLWLTFKQIIENIKDENFEFILFCEDDHKFLSNFEPEQLERDIAIGKELNADLLLGGVSWFDVAVKATERIFWLNKFSGCQFMVIYKKFFPNIMSISGFNGNEALDHKLSNLTSNTFVIHPFISVQKEFGYSDVTFFNGKAGRVTQLFEQSIKRLDILNKVSDFFNSNKQKLDVCQKTQKK